MLLLSINIHALYSVQIFKLRTCDVKNPNISRLKSYEKKKFVLYLKGKFVFFQLFFLQNYPKNTILM